MSLSLMALSLPTIRRPMRSPLPGRSVPAATKAYCCCQLELERPAGITRSLRPGAGVCLDGWTRFSTSPFQTRPLMTRSHARLRAAAIIFACRPISVQHPSISTTRLPKPCGTWKRLQPPTSRPTLMRLRASLPISSTALSAMWPAHGRRLRAARRSQTWPVEPKLTGQCVQRFCCSRQRWAAASRSRNWMSSMR